MTGGLAERCIYLLQRRVREALSQISPLAVHGFEAAVKAGGDRPDLYSPSKVKTSAVTIVPQISLLRRLACHCPQIISPPAYRLRRLDGVVVSHKS